MSWYVNGNNLTFAEDDYGVELPLTFKGITFTARDKVEFVVKKEMNGDAILTKTFTDISNNQIVLMLTNEDTALLPVGSYIYRLDWYQDGAFMCNLVPSASMKVVDKA